MAHTVPGEPGSADRERRQAADEASRADAYSPLHGGEEPCIIGDSPEMLRVFRSIRRFARCSFPVLITGESGTGKELVALAIHERSDYADGPFVAVNCGGLPSELVASELFGHEKGAFTGAHAQRIGKVEHANGGTLFLDEIGEMPLDLQPHMLRFLQEQKIQRVGSNKEVEVDVRIVAATNANLEELVGQGRFREDLFFRLDVLRLDIPPLRERPGDLDLLAGFFIKHICAEMGVSEKPLTEGALTVLRGYNWPGNVRELISRLRRAVVLSDQDHIGPENFGLDYEYMAYEPFRASAPVQTADNGTLEQSRRHAEAQVLVDALRKEHGNITKASKRVGVSRVTFYKLLDKHNIDRRSMSTLA